MSELDLDFAKLITPIDRQPFFAIRGKRNRCLYRVISRTITPAFFRCDDVNFMVYFTRPRFSGIRTETTRPMH